MKSRSYVGEQNELYMYGSICDSVSKFEPLMEFASDELAQFCSAYCSSHDRATYKTGIPPLQAIFCTLMMDPNVKDDLSGDQMKSKTSLYDMIAFILKVVHVKSQDEERLVVERFLKDLRVCSVGYDQDPYPELSSLETIIKEAHRFTTEMSVNSDAVAALSRYRLFHTANGFLGLAPRKLLPGDLICAIRECSFPLLLRKEQSHYVHVGPCFVLGLMNGEVERLIKDGSTSIQQFVVF